MRIIRYISGGRTCLGLSLDDGKSARRIDGELFGSFHVTDEVLPVEKLLAPIIPAEIICVGLNYRAHAAESNAPIPKVPVLFMKASGTLNNPGDPIFIPRLSSMIDFEAELAVLIGKIAKHVKKENAFDHVFGYTCANDVSARDWQQTRELGGGQWVRGKSFDSFCPIGPWIVTKDEIPNPNALKIRSILNGQVMQDHTTADMIFDVPTLIESLSSTLTLKPGTVILTGTPPGVGFARTPPVWMKAGDTIVIEIEMIGRLENPLCPEV